MTPRTAGGQVGKNRKRKRKKIADAVSWFRQRTKATGSFLRKFPHRITTWPYSWMVLAACAMAAGGTWSFMALSHAYDRYKDGTLLENLLATYTFYGLLIVGVSQLMRAASHGTGDVRKRIDGWGKVLGVFGWSMGLTGAAFTVITREHMPNEWATNMLQAGVAVPLYSTAFIAVLIFTIWLIRPKRSDQTPNTSGEA